MFPSVGKTLESDANQNTGVQLGTLPGVELPR